MWWGGRAFGSVAAEMDGRREGRERGRIETENRERERPFLGTGERGESRKERAPSPSSSTFPPRLDPT